MDKKFQELFHINNKRKNLRVGDILIAEPFMENNFFSRSVIYITEHDRNGSVGFVLNAPSYEKTSGVFEDWQGIDYGIDLGGPVETERLYYLHDSALLQDALEIVEGIYWGGDFLQLKDLLDRKKITGIRFFAGYSGWEKGQLEEEIREGSWLISEISKKDLFQLSGNKLWENSMAKLGGHRKMWANIPHDPILN